MYDDTCSNDMEERFRASAIGAFGVGDSSIDSDAVWRDLVEGRAQIVDEFTTPRSLFLILRSRSGPPLAPRTLQIVEQVLLGTVPKVVSIERRLSESTISCNLKQALEAIGLRCKPSKVPLLLVTLVHAAKGRIPFEHGRSAIFEYAGTTYRVLSMPSPNQVFERMVSPAEQAVLRMRLEGKSHAEIAARRQTSLRTVANQIASAFHRLGVTRRSDLMVWLIAPKPAFSPIGESVRPLRSPRSSLKYGRGRTRAPSETHGVFTQ